MTRGRDSAEHASAIGAGVVVEAVVDLVVVVVDNGGVDVDVTGERVVDADDIGLSDDVAEISSIVPDVDLGS